MTQRNRKLIGILLFLLSLVIWSSLATSIYLSLPSDLPLWLLMPYFVVVGLGWLWPAMAIIRWMARPNA